MSFIKTLVPAYSRDYKKRIEVLADFESNKDFKYYHFNGQIYYVNKEDLQKTKDEYVLIRYDNDKKLCRINIV